MNIVLNVLFVELQHFLDLAHWPILYTNFKRVMARIGSNNHEEGERMESSSMFIIQRGV